MTGTNACHLAVNHRSNAHISVFLSQSYLWTFLKHLIMSEKENVTRRELSGTKRRANFVRVISHVKRNRNNHQINVQLCTDARSAGEMSADQKCQRLA